MNQYRGLLSSKFAWFLQTKNMKHVIQLQLLIFEQQKRNKDKEKVKQNVINELKSIRCAPSGVATTIQFNERNERKT